MKSGEEYQGNDIPYAEVARKFWGNIWRKEVQHNIKASKLQECKRKMEIGVTQNITIMDKKAKAMIKKISNWKVLQTRKCSGFLVQESPKYTQLYATIFFTDCVKNGTPTWMAKVKIVLLKH